MNEDALRALKAAARIDALARRQACDPALGERLTEFVLAACPPRPGAIISGFWPIGDEIDIRPLMTVLAARGHELCLPETPVRGNPLIFRRWRQGEPLQPGRFGTSHPSGPVAIPDFILVPLLAFDRSFHRLGYGGGYYDRTLAALPDAFALGCAFAAQEVAAVPVGPFDRQLDAIVTEVGLNHRELN